MNESDQMRRAQRWAEDIPNESAATTAALDAFVPEVRERIVQAANIGATINIYKVSSAVQFGNCLSKESWLLALSHPAGGDAPAVHKHGSQRLCSCFHL